MDEAKQHRLLTKTLRTPQQRAMRNLGILSAILIGILGLMIALGGKGDGKYHEPDFGPAPKSEITSKDLCVTAIKQRATHPSTLDIHAFIGWGSTLSTNGTRYSRLSFDAPNGYDVKIKYEALCNINPKGDLSISIAERDY
jgi:hypothetical protein